MILKIFLILSVILNLFFFKKIFFKHLRNKRIGSKIPTVSIQNIDKDFEFEQIDKNLIIPKINTLSKTIFFAEGNYKGVTSDYESWIMSVIAKKCKNIFEFGTCSGKTTFLLAENSPDDCQILTLTLDEELIKKTQYSNEDNKIAIKNAVNESIYTKFFFTGKDCEKKIKVIFQDSKKFPEENYLNMFDMIFIDGGHSYSFVKNDTEKAFKMIKKNGIIFWHDYIMYKKSTSDVVKYLSSISKSHKIFHIQNTNMCFFRNVE